MQGVHSAPPPAPFMQHLSRLVLVVNHAGSGASDAERAAHADSHWHTVLTERPCTALPDGDLDYFLRRPHTAPTAAPAAVPAVPAAPDLAARALAASFAT